DRVRAQQPRGPVERRLREPARARRSLRRTRPLVVPHRRLPQLRDDAHRRHRRLQPRPSRTPRRRQRADLLLTAAQRRGPRSVTSASRDTVRLVAFGDGVFAITLWPSYLAYAVTFLFIGQVWANHHVMFDHIRAADRIVLLLNILLLMAVAFLPFATSVLAGALRAGSGERTAVVFYCIAF